MLEATCGYVGQISCLDCANPRLYALKTEGWTLLCLPHLARAKSRGTQKYKNRRVMCGFIELHKVMF